MSDLRQVEVIDRDGWRKSYPLEKNIIHIGSDPRNDILLEPQRGTGVSQRHVQMIPGTNGSFRLVNVGDSDISLGDNRDRRVPPRAFADVHEGEQVNIGDFSIIFRGTAPLAANIGGRSSGAGGASSNSPSISAQLSLTRTEIAPDQPIDGVILVRNLGEKSSVMFKLVVEGLEPELYEIGPGPILASEAEARVFIRLKLVDNLIPPAGQRKFAVRVTAPNAYLGESAVAMQTISVKAVYDYHITLTSAD